MVVSNKDGNISESNEILQKNKDTNKKGEMEDAIMKVMTKLFSAKVVLERLPNSYEHENVTIKEESFEPDESNCDPIPAQKDTHKQSDELPVTCARENVIVKEEVVDLDETYETITVHKTRNWRGIHMAHMFTKICPKHCNDKYKGKMSSKRCRKCKSHFIYECKTCKKTLKTYGGILHHLLTTCNFQGDYYQCPHCSFQARLRYSVVCHVKKLHSDKQKDSIKKINHEDYEKNSRKYVYKCSKCDQGFRKPSRFITHCKLYCDTLEHAIDRSNIIKPTGIEEDALSTEIPDTLLAKKMCVRYCSTCDKETDLKDNTTKCSDCNKTLLIKCSKCNQTNKRIHDIVRHLRNKCAVQKNYKCSKCEYTNAIQMLVLGHYKNVHEPTPVECPRCGRILKNKRTCTVHKRYCSEKAHLLCDIGKCSFKTNNPASLKTHKNRHLQKDNSNCPKCGKTFINRVTMKNHLFSCGIPRRFRCDNCPHVSKQKRDLEKHILRKHMRDINNDYDVCPNCGVALKNKRSGKGHLRFCGTSKRHRECNFCYFMTHNQYYLRIHMAKCHPAKIENDNSGTEDEEEAIDIKMENYL